MSVIKTWKCDGCGAIARGDQPDWYALRFEALLAPRRELFGPSREIVSRHVCSVECVSAAAESARDEIEQMERAA